MAISPLLPTGMVAVTVCCVVSTTWTCSAARHHVQRTAVWRHRKIRRVVSDGDRGDDGIRGGIDHRDGVGPARSSHTRGCRRGSWRRVWVRCRPEPCPPPCRSPCRSPRRAFAHGGPHRPSFAPPPGCARCDEQRKPRQQAEAGCTRPTSISYVHVNTSSCMRRARRRARNRGYTERLRPGRRTCNVVLFGVLPERDRAAQ